jgi:hypothetical protein
MGFSDRILGKKNVNGGPHIESVSPVLALAGGEVRIAGSGLRSQQYQRPHVRFGEVWWPGFPRGQLPVQWWWPPMGTSAMPKL